MVKNFDFLFLRLLPQSQHLRHLNQNLDSDSDVVDADFEEVTEEKESQNS